MDKHLVFYIMSFLQKCDKCRIYSEKTSYKCVLCNRKYCFQCKDFLYKIHGFYENNYCKECYNYAIFS